MRNVVGNGLDRSVDECAELGGETVKTGPYRIAEREML